MWNHIVNRVKRATPLVVGETPPDTLEETVHVEAASGAGAPVAVTAS